jgi:hypothetical protein
VSQRRGLTIGITVHCLGTSQGTTFQIHVNQVAGTASFVGGFVNVDTGLRGPAILTVVTSGNGDDGDDGDDDDD